MLSFHPNRVLRAHYNIKQYSKYTKSFSKTYKHRNTQHQPGRRANSSYWEGGGVSAVLGNSSCKMHLLKSWLVNSVSTEDSSRFHLLLPSLWQYVFDYHDGDVFGCVADIGWITGHSYVVYGPLCNGGTTVLFESTPVYPNPGKQ